MSRRGNDLVGQKFGRLTVVKDSGERCSGAIKWLCVCECGNTCTPVSKRLKNGLTVSCGCYRKTRATTHGETNTKLYEIWASMKQRVSNPNKDRYANYGGRGIGICEEWNDYLNFSKWAKESEYKEGLSIERINVDGNYQPDNCKWTTMDRQANNKTTNHFLTLNNKTQSVADWSRETGINEGTIRSRIRRGWTVERALTETVH